MPKNLTPAMRAHLDAETTRLAAIWRITRKDGQQFFFTDHDRDIVFGGETYRADAGFERTAIRSDAGFAVDNLDLVGVFAEGGIVEDEVRAGLFDGAEIALSFVNWQDPDTYGEIKLRRGTLGEVRLTPQGHFTARAAGPVAAAGAEHAADLRPGLSRRSRRPSVQVPDQATGARARAGRAARRVLPGRHGRWAAGFQVYEDRIYEVTAAGTTDAVQPTYDTTIGNPTTDGTAMLTARDSFMRVAVVETVTSNRVFTANDVLAAYRGSLVRKRRLDVRDRRQRRPHARDQGLDPGDPYAGAVGAGQARRSRSATSSASTPGAASAWSRTAATSSRSPAVSCSPRATPGIFGASPTCRAAPWWRSGWPMTSHHARHRRHARPDRCGRLPLRPAGGRRPVRWSARSCLAAAGQKVEGPRLGDLSVAASTYGGVIPVGFGTQKVAGTIIWATDIRETKHTNTQGGGLFGGGTKIVEYRYFASFAVALGEGPAGAVTRIWAGDKLIARLRSSDHAKANHSKYRFRIYLGTEDQQPDPLIRKHVPAQRCARAPRPGLHRVRGPAAG